MQLDLLTSGIWQTNSAILSHRGDCLVVDPAYFPRELEAIAAAVGERGRAEAVVFTHGHWDHVMGHGICPDAPVWMHQGLASEIAEATPRAAKYLEDARQFDSRWYVPRPHGHRWPTVVRPLADEERLELAGAALHALHLPGHSPDGLALVVEALGLMTVGDYLSPCEIPFLDEPGQYRATLARLIELLGGGGDKVVAQVVPGHGPQLSAAEALAIARADLEYVERLLDAGIRGDAEAALAVELPRAADVVGMRDAHRANCDKLGLTLPPLQK
jgi:hydroxyacylglutathione hydrolase